MSVLVWLMLIPFLGGCASWAVERWSLALPRWIALFSMLLMLLLALSLWTPEMTLTAGTATPVWQIELQKEWIPRFGISFHLGLDGLSLLMVILTGLLGLLAVGCSWKEIQRHVGFFHLNLLWNLAGVVGVFLALDLFLFFLFWEAMLVPMWFLIALWGHRSDEGRDRVYAANKFFLFTQASGLIMLVAIVALVLLHYKATGILSFDYHELLKARFEPLVEWLLMLGFFIAFAVKLPVVPFHTWLPDAHSQAPTAGSVDLAGVLLKTAAYGLLRFGVPLFPNASMEFAPIAMWLGVFSIIYGAWLAFVQHDVKRLVAYTSISHMGFVLIGIYSGTITALQGVIMQMLAHGLSAGALFILCGEVYERIHTRDLRKMGGLWSRMPYLPPIALFFTAASIGVPGLGNFIGELLILIGTFTVAPLVTICAAVGFILASIYGLVMIQRAFYGTPSDKTPLTDLSSREVSIMLCLMALLLWMGLYPQPILDRSLPSMQFVEQVYRPAVETAPLAIQEAAP